MDKIDLKIVNIVMVGNMQLDKKIDGEQLEKCIKNGWKLRNEERNQTLSKKFEEASVILTRNGKVIVFTKKNTNTIERLLKDIKAKIVYNGSKIS